MNYLDILTSFIHISFLLYLVFRDIQMLKTARESASALFFLYAVISFLVSDLYWITYELLRPGTRMPFAANEIGEAAGFLLFASSLDAEMRGHFPKNRIQRPGKMNLRLLQIFTVLFTAACTGLWIAWSGEWIQDIVTGVILGFFFCKIVTALDLSEAFSRRKWMVLGISSSFLILLEYATLLTSGTIRNTIDLICYILMFAIGFFILSGTLQAFREKKQPEKCISLSFAGFVWATSMMYMSSGLWYTAGLFICGVFLIMMLSAVGRKEETV